MGNKNSGRPRKPLAKHKLDGTYRDDEHGSRGSAKADGVPLKPPDLPEMASYLWDRLETQLVAWGAGEIDSEPIADMCRWWSEYRAMMDAGDVYKAKACYTQFAFLACRYGLTIADREKLNISGPSSADAREGKFYGVVG